MWDISAPHRALLRDLGCPAALEVETMELLFTPTSAPGGLGAMVHVDPACFDTGYLSRHEADTLTWSSCHLCTRDHPRLWELGGPAKDMAVVTGALADAHTALDRVVEAADGPPLAELHRVAVQLGSVMSALGYGTARFVVTPQAYTSPDMKLWSGAACTRLLARAQEARARYRDALVAVHAGPGAHVPTTLWHVGTVDQVLLGMHSELALVGQAVIAGTWLAGGMGHRWALVKVPAVHESRRGVSVAEGRKQITRLGETGPGDGPEVWAAYAAIVDAGQVTPDQALSLARTIAAPVAV
jgi:hypothetical protein